MRRILSTRLFANHRLTTASLDKVQHSEIDSVELFCARQHLDYRNRSQIAELKHWFADSELDVAGLHAPLYTDDSWGRGGPRTIVSLTTLDKAARIRSTDEIKRAIEIADSIPLQFVVVQLGQFEEDYDPAKLDSAFNAIDELNVFASQPDVEVLIKNLPSEQSNAEHLSLLLDVTHLPVGYCFDVGLAHIGEGVRAEFGKMRDRVRAVRLHDNDGTSDLRLAPFVDYGGTVDWSATSELLSEHDNAPRVLELHRDGDLAPNLQVASESLDRLEELFNNHG